MPSPYPDWNLSISLHRERLTVQDATQHRKCESDRRTCPTSPTHTSPPNAFFTPPRYTFRPRLTNRCSHACLCNSTTQHELDYSQLRVSRQCLHARVIGAERKTSGSHLGSHLRRCRAIISVMMLLSSRPRKICGCHRRHFSARPTCGAMTALGTRKRFCTRDAVLRRVHSEVFVVGSTESVLRKYSDMLCVGGEGGGCDVFG
jgi:hypothetical protein